MMPGIRLLQVAVPVILAVAATPARAAEASSPNFAIESSVLGGGGGAMASPSFSVEGVVGQPVLGGDASSTNFAANGGFLNDRDLDSDNVLGPADACPAQTASCWDQDGDGCIDVPDPDDDTDGVTRGSCDCNDLDIQIWDTPGEAIDLVWGGDPVAGTEFLQWSAPVVPGGSALVYDILRSADPSDFVATALCVESDDGSDLEAIDPATPAPGSLFHYLVRAENACPQGSGTLGARSNLNLRAGRACP